MVFKKKLSFLSILISFIVFLIALIPLFISNKYLIMITFVLVFLIILNILFERYTIKEHFLTIRRGLFKNTYNIFEIEQINMTKSIEGNSMLEIVLSGELVEKVSPLEEREFIIALMRINPKIKLNNSNRLREFEKVSHLITSQEKLNNMQNKVHKIARYSKVWYI
ncbi:PH domain-containing protein [Mammaliicoccus fleurettii]|uniref:PH domain-containing protein n=2 Tax=Mammaliicoccus fleurettii TaxID=150056 RepID=A0ABS5MKM8_9STAP|nr:PH domain-containing protein [Mammaliicoccus fleurettii]MBS3671158.1 PH domain-containing protein [Mammaliicoccus fleurettii]MBS3696468.1 PH domain-containing protein [Mammaliicoccus fleurettii]